MQEANVIDSVSDTPTNIVASQNKNIKKTKYSSNVDEKFGESLLEELRASRPKSPIRLEKSSDDKFGDYLVSLMSQLSPHKRRKLQEEFISTVISQLDN